MEKNITALSEITFKLTSLSFEGNFISRHFLGLGRDVSPALRVMLLFMEKQKSRIRQLHLEGRLWECESYKDIVFPVLTELRIRADGRSCQRFQIS